MAADGHLDEADADAIATGIVVALALETGTGSKKVAWPGAIVRDDTWNWTTGPAEAGLIFLSAATTGGMTQTPPSGSGDVVQVVGFALTDDCMMFLPQLHAVEIA